MAGNEAEYRWHKADGSDIFAHCPDHVTKNIFYAREYTSGEGFNFSDTNQLILNLKIPPAAQGRAHYKRQAIQRFAAEAAAFLNAIFKAPWRAVLVPLPPSKTPNHAEYDDRLQQVATQVAQRCSQVTVQAFLERSESRNPRHATDEGRSAEAELMTLRLSASCAGFSPGEHEVIVIFDDVTTSGGSFEAARQLLQARYPDANIMGVMWAKAKPRPVGV